MCLHAALPVHLLISTGNKWLHITRLVIMAKSLALNVLQSQVLQSTWPWPVTALVGLKSISELFTTRWLLMVAYALLHALGDLPDI